MSWFDRAVSRAGIKANDLKPTVPEIDERDTGILDRLGDAASDVGDWIGSHMTSVENNPMYDDYTKLADHVLTDDRSLAADNNTTLGAFSNAAVHGAAGTGAGLARMFHADTLADRLNAVAKNVEDTEAIDPSFSLEYILNPHGLARSTGEVAGSVASIAPTAMFVPEGVVGAGTGLVGRMGANRALQWLINNGYYTAANRIASTIPGSIQYGLGSALTESLAEGGGSREEALNAGLGEGEATKRSIETAALNLPLLMASNTVEAGLLRGLMNIPARAGAGAVERVATAPFRSVPGAIANGLQQGTEEFYQEGIQAGVAGRDYGLTPFTGSDEQYKAAAEGFAGSLLPGLAGGTVSGLGRRRREERSDRSIGEMQERLAELAEARRNAEQNGSGTEDGISKVIASIRDDVRRIQDEIDAANTQPEAQPQESFEVPSERQFIVAGEVSNPSVTDLTEQKMRLLDRDYYQKYGKHLYVTSMSREGNPDDSWHNTGQAFDTADDLLESDAEARNWLIEQGKKYGLYALDEYEHPSANATGGHVHFSDHGEEISGNYDSGTSESSRNADDFSDLHTKNPDPARIWDFLRASGYSEEATAGIMGRMKQERGDFSATMEPFQMLDGIGEVGGMGMFQWTYDRGEGDTPNPDSRLAYYLQWCEENNLEPEDALNQLTYMRDVDLKDQRTTLYTGHTFDPDEMNALDRHGAADLWTRHYERGQAGNEHDYADEIFNQYSGRKVGAPSPGVSRNTGKTTNAAGTSTTQRQEPIEIPDESSKLYEDFAREQMKDSQSYNWADFVDFFKDGKPDGEFLGTEENLAKIKELAEGAHAKAFDDFMTRNAPQEEAPEAKPPKAKTAPETPKIETKADRLASLRDKLEEKKEEARKAQDFATVSKINKALMTENTDSMISLAGVPKNYLEAPEPIDVDSQVTQAQPTQTQNVQNVQGTQQETATPSENGTNQGQVKSAQNQTKTTEERDSDIRKKAYEYGMSPVAETKQEREKQGKGLILTASTAELSLPDKLKRGLRNGSADAIREAQEIVRKEIPAPAFFDGAVPISRSAIEAIDRAGGTTNENTEATNATPEKGTGNAKNQNQNAESGQGEKGQVDFLSSLGIDPERLKAERDNIRDMHHKQLAEDEASSGKIPHLDRAVNKDHATAAGNMAMAGYQGKNGWERGILGAKLEEALKDPATSKQAMEAIRKMQEEDEASYFAGDVHVQEGVGKSRKPTHIRSKDSGLTPEAQQKYARKDWQSFADREGYTAGTEDAPHTRQGKTQEKKTPKAVSTFRKNASALVDKYRAGEISYEDAHTQLVGKILEDASRGARDEATRNALDDEVSGYMSQIEEISQGKSATNEAQGKSAQNAPVAETTQNEAQENPEEKAKPEAENKKTNAEEKTSKPDERTKKPNRSYDEWQEEIDKYENELIEKYGEDAVLFGEMKHRYKSDPVPKEERAHLNELYDARNSGWKAEDDAYIEETLDLIKNYNPLPREGVREILENLVRESNLDKAFGRKDAKKFKQVMEKVYTDAANMLHYGSYSDAEGNVYPYDFMDFEGSLKIAADESRGWHSPYGISPKPLLKQAKDITNAIFRIQDESEPINVTNQADSKSNVRQLKEPARQEKPTEKQESAKDPFGDKETNIKEMLEGLGITEEAEETVEFTDEFGDTTDEEIEALKEKIHKKMNRLSANALLDPELYVLYLQLGGKYIQKGYRTFKKWMGKMTSDFGEEAEPWATAVWETLKTYPKGQKFEPKQVMLVTRVVGNLYGEGTTSLDAVQAEMKKLLKGKHKQFAPMVEASYNGVKKFYDTIREGENNGKSGKSGESDTGRTAGESGHHQGSEAVSQGSERGQESVPERAGSHQQTGEGVEETAPENDKAPEETRDTGGLRSSVSGTEGRQGDEAAGSGLESGGRESGSERVSSPVVGRGRRDGGRTDAEGKGLAGVRASSDGTHDTGTNPGVGKTDRRDLVNENYHMEDPDALLGGTTKVRFARNRKAIETFRELQASKRQPTQEEKDAMAAYTGWGSFAQELFQGDYENPKPQKGWEKESEWLHDNLTKEEWESARDSTINAHYTAPVVVQAMWDMARRMGFKGGRVLEPSMGVGNFFGLMPKDMEASSTLFGVEMDSLTGGIAKMLYPKANIKVSPYEKVRVADGTYDIVIGNVPFDSRSPADRRYDKFNATLHDYFFLKGIDELRTGGIMMAITSKGTMDKIHRDVRMELARKAELVDAYRFPTGAFKEYAGTDVVTDVLVFRKRETPLLDVSKEEWLGTTEQDTGIRNHKTGSNYILNINNFFMNHPEKVLGTMGFGRASGHGPGLAVTMDQEKFQDQLDNMAKSVPEKVYEEPHYDKNISYISNASEDRIGTLQDVKGNLYVAVGVESKPIKEAAEWAFAKNLSEKTRAKRIEELKDLVKLRKAYAALETAEKNDAKDMEKLRKKLKETFDAHVAKYCFEKGKRKTVTKKGEKVPMLLEDTPGMKMFFKAGEPNYFSLAALENKKGEPAAILTERVMRSAKKDIANPTVKEALMIQRNKSMRIDIDEIAKLSKKSKEEVLDELKDYIFKTPNGEYQSKDQYLSGNVRRKLREAQSALENGDKSMERNIEALKKVMPDDIPYYNINVGFGGTWIDLDYYKQFIADMIGGADASKISVTRNVNGAWTVKFDDKSYNNTAGATTTYGVSDVKFDRLLTHALNHTKPKISKKDANGNTFTDEEAMQKAVEQMDKIRETFAAWVWKDEQRKTDLAHSYNEALNNTAKPSYDGSFLDMVGMMLKRGEKVFNLRKHQINAIYRGLVNGSGIYAHEVGTGKTYTMGGLALESRRFGLAKKPLILAHNANSASVAKEIQEMYPGAKICYISGDSKSVKRDIMRVKNDDWDVVVMPHSKVDKLTLTEETLNSLAADMIAQLEDDAREAAQAEHINLDRINIDDADEVKKISSPTVKELVKQRLRIKENILKSAYKASDEDAIPFEDLGIDMIIADESHMFKKPPFSTKMNVKGLQKESSLKSIQFNFITQYVQGQNNGRGVHLFTGTPITNTITEMYHNMRYVMPNVMKEAGVYHFDDWFNAFAQIDTNLEYASTGETELVDRLNSFVNLTELRRMVGQYMDIVFADDMPEFEPRKTESGKTLASKDLTEKEKDYLINGRDEDAVGRPYMQTINEVIKMNDAQKGILEKFLGYARTWRDASKSVRKTIMQKSLPQSPLFTMQAIHKAAMDARMYNNTLNTSGMDSKEARVASNVMKIYNSDPRTTQVIMMETGMNDSSKDVIRRDENDTPVVGDNGKPVRWNAPTYNLQAGIKKLLIEHGIPEKEIAVVNGGTSPKAKADIAEKVATGQIRVVFGSTDTLGTGVNMQDNLKAIHHVDAPWMPGELEQRNGRILRQGNKWNTVYEYRYITEKLDGRRWQILSTKQKFIKAFLTAADDIRVLDGDAVDMSDEDSAGNGDLEETLSKATGDPRFMQKANLEQKVERLEKAYSNFTAGIEEAKFKLKNLKDGRLEELKDSVKRLKGIQEKYSAYKQQATGFHITIGGKVYDNQEEANDVIAKLFDSTGRVDKEFNLGEYAGLNLYGVKESHEGVTGRYYDYKIRITDSNKAIPGFDCKNSTGGIIQKLSRLDSAIENGEERVKNAENDIKTLEKQVKETFPREKELNARKKQLEAVEKDLQENPVPPPSWLVEGAPMQSDVLVDGKKGTVEGYKATPEGDFYVKVKKDGKGNAKLIPWQKVMDTQGLPMITAQEGVKESPEYEEEKPNTEAGEAQEEKPSSQNQTPTSNRKYSIDGRSEESGFSNARSMDEIKAGTREAYPNAKITEDGNTLHLTMPNGQKVHISIVSEINVSEGELSKAKEAHGFDQGAKVIVEGYAEVVGGEGFSAVAQGSRDVTDFHESYHMAELMAFTKKELADAERLISPDSEKRADEYAKWRKSRQKHSNFAKLWQKIADVAAKMAGILGYETKRNVFRKVESGEIYERDNAGAKDAEKKFSLDNSDNSQKSWFQKVKNLVGYVEGAKGKELFRRKMTDMLSEACGVKIRYGHKNTANGVTVEYNEKKKTIRSAHAYDWKNILPVASDLIAERLGVQKSDAMRNYITNWVLEGAPNNTSKEADEFHEAMQRNPHYGDRLLNLRFTFQEWADKSAEERMDASVQWAKPSDVSWKDRKNDLYDQFIESLGPVERLVKEAKKNGVEIADAVNPAVAFRLFRGNYGRAITMIEGRGENALHGLQMNFPGVDFTGFKTLHDIMKGIGALQNIERQKDFVRYCMNKHILDMHQRNKDMERYIDALDVRKDEIAEEIENLKKEKDELKGKLSLYQSEVKRLEQIDKEIKKNRDELAQCDKETKQWQEKHMAIPDAYSEEECKKVIEKLKDEFDEAQKQIVTFSDVTAQILYKGGVISYDRLKNMRKAWPNYVPLFRVFEENEEISFGDSLATLEGSDRDFINPLESIVKNTVEFIKRAEKNKAKCLLADLAMCEGTGSLLDIVDDANPNDKTTIIYYENGKKKYLQTDPSVVNAINTMDRRNSNAVLKFIHAITSFGRSMFTMFSPEFALRNVLRDYADAFVYGKNGIIGIRDFVRGMMHAIHRDATYYEWLSSGAAIASAVSLDRDYTQEMIDKLGRSMLTRAKSGPKGALFAALEFLQKGGEYSEYATRISRYEKTKKTLIKEKRMEAQEALISAAFESRDLMDFSRSGEAGAFWNKLVPFANASLQGMDKFYREVLDPEGWRTNPKQMLRTTARMILVGVLPSLLLGMLYGDDDWYKEQPEWLRETHWTLKLTENVLLRIPKGNDIGVRLFSNLVEKALDKEPHKLREYATPFWDMLPDLLPIVFKPLIEANLNKSFFTGKAIVPTHQEKSLPEKLQYGPYTTGFSKFLGEKLGISPSKIDHVIAGYGGSLGMLPFRLVDILAGDRQLDTSITEMPITRALTYMPYKNPRSVTRYYEELDKQKKLQNEYKMTHEKPDDFDPAYLKRLESIDKEMKKLSKRERDAINNKSYDIDQRKSIQNDIQKRRISLVNRVLK